MVISKKPKHNDNFKNDAITMALTFYTADVDENFKKVDNKIMTELIKEISALSLAFPIHLPNAAYQKGDVKKGMKLVPEWNDDKPVEYLSATNENKITITIGGKPIKKDVSPLYLMALYTYGFNKISGNQLSKRNMGFDYLKMGLMLSKKEREKK